MRANRVRIEAGKLKDAADAKHMALSGKVMELAAAGVQLPEDLTRVVEEINSLAGEIARKEDEIRAINAEQWVEGVIITESTQDPIAQRLQAYVEAKNSDFMCPACGATIRASKTFCPKCGRKVLR